jgi:hypothetical protein
MLICTLRIHVKEIKIIIFFKNYVFNFLNIKYLTLLMLNFYIDYLKIHINISQN